MGEGISCDQKAWQFIRAQNEGDERLDALAIADVDRDYTYRQVFRWQDRYAEVFSALGVTEANGSRVGVVCSLSASSVFAFLALNMLGVSVSAVSIDDLIVPKWLLRAVEVEGITDLVLPDTIARPDTLHAILMRRPEVGLRHIIVVETSMQTPCPTAGAQFMLMHNLQQIRSMPGVLLMRDLLARYAATPIAYGGGTNDDAAVIVHSSGTTKGTHKPIPLSDVALNTAAARMLADERLSPMRDGGVVLWNLPISFSTGMVNVVFASLAFGVTLRLHHCIMDAVPSPDILLNIEKYKVSALFGAHQMFDALYENPRAKDLDLSSLRIVVFGGSAMSSSQLKRAREFIRAHGGDPRILNGYGLSECGAANTLAELSEVDHGIGQPLEGVSVRIRDEESGEFYAIDGKPHVGTLYLSSPTNSCGRLGDQVLFELQQIDGASYVCTNDLVRTDEAGDLFFVGRANRMFVNNDGLTFDANAVENALSEQPGISECVIVGAYEKVLTHDTVPVLYVQVERTEGDEVGVVRRALKAAYASDKDVARNALPWMCVIVDTLPHAMSGKVDVMAIQIQGVRGREFTVASVEQRGELVDVQLIPAKEGTVGKGDLLPAGIPQGMRKDRLEQMIALQRTLGPDFLRMLASGAGIAAFSALKDVIPTA